MTKNDFTKLTKKQQLAFRYKKKLYFRNYRARNREKTNNTAKLSRFNIKIQAFNAYGGCECIWCGENDVIVLTIDHINNNSKHRGGNWMYNWLKKNNYPPGFQVLCFNCNCTKALNDGILPENRFNKYRL